MKKKLIENAVNASIYIDKAERSWDWAVSRADADKEQINQWKEEAELYLKIANVFAELANAYKEIES